LPPFVDQSGLRAALQNRAIVGIDADEQALARNRGLTYRVRGDIQRLPFRSASFDLASANMVVEHPALLFEEIARVLLGRAALDVYPTHYRANTEAALARLLNPVRWHLDRVEYVESSAQFAQVPPAAALELTAIRVLRSPRWQHFRTCLLVVAEPRPHA
jgi:ubiquinone/menaquinone biosynthesis C-methylase UbiE